MTQTALCKACGLPFDRVIDKGSPKQYCSRLCRSAVKRSRNLANREKRRHLENFGLDAVKMMLLSWPNGTKVMGLDGQMHDITKDDIDNAQPFNLEKFVKDTLESFSKQGIKEVFIDGDCLRGVSPMVGAVDTMTHEQTD